MLFCNLPLSWCTSSDATKLSDLIQLTICFSSSTQRFFSLILMQSSFSTKLFFWFYASSICPNKIIVDQIMMACYAFFKKSQYEAMNFFPLSLGYFSLVSLSKKTLSWFGKQSLLHAENDTYCWKNSEMKLAPTKSKCPSMASMLNT